MARDQVALTISGWTELTNANVTAITFMVLKGAVEIRYSVGSVSPSDSDRGVRYEMGEGELTTNISDLVNLSGANRVWAIDKIPGSQVYVDHA